MAVIEDGSQNQETRIPPTYEPPTLVWLGPLHDRTQLGGGPSLDMGFVGST